MFSCLSKKLFLNRSQFHDLHIIILLQYIMWIKSRCRLCFLDIRTGTFKRICVWFTQNFQVWSKYLLPCAFWVNYSNKRRVMMRRLFEGGVYLYFSSKLRCLVGAAFNRIITVCSEFEIYQIFCWRLVSSTIQDGGKCGHFG